MHLRKPQVEINRCIYLKVREQNNHNQFFVHFLHLFRDVHQPLSIIPPRTFIFARWIREAAVLAGIFIIAAMAF